MREMNFAAVRHWDRGGIGSILAIALAATAILGCEKVGLPVEKKSATTAVVARQDVIGYAFFDGKVVTPPGAMATVVRLTMLRLGKSSCPRAVGLAVGQPSFG